MIRWSGSRLGQGLWEPYNNNIQNTPIRISHNLDIPQTLQKFSLYFRSIQNHTEVLGGANYYFDGESGPKFYITRVTPNDFVIEIRPQLSDNEYEYLIELSEDVRDQEVIVSTGDSFDSYGFDVSYRFNFGDGTISDWSGEGTASHLYESPGTYEVRSQASAEGIISLWSDPLTLTVYDDPVVVPAPPKLSGESKVQLDLMTSYEISGSPIFDGTIEYRVDWKDGVISDWTIYNTFSHTWSEEGTYEITCQARSAIGYKQVSNWSLPLTVEVVSQYDLLSEIALSEASEDSIVQVSPKPTCSNLTVRGQVLEISVPPVNVNQGESVEYKLNYGNGIITNYQSSNVFYYKYDYEGQYLLTSRVKKQVLIDYSYQWVEFEWSEAFSINIKERVLTTPTTPVTPNGITEITSRRKGVVTTDPSGELYIQNTSKKWICDYIQCPGVGAVWVSHGLDEYPYLAYIDFDLEGDLEGRAIEKRFLLDDDESGKDITVDIKRQRSGLIPVTFHKCITSYIPDSLGNEVPFKASRYKILVRS